jgi:putative transposase
VLDGIARSTDGIDRTLPSRRVTDVLDRVIGERGKPQKITIDNGTEFTSNHFDAWVIERKIVPDFIHPGRPVENGYVESSNGRLCDE